MAFDELHGVIKRSTGAIFDARVPGTPVGVLVIEMDEHDYRTCQDDEACEILRLARKGLALDRCGVDWDELGRLENESYDGASTWQYHEDHALHCAVRTALPAILRVVRTEEERRG